MATKFNVEVRRAIAGCGFQVGCKVVPRLAETMLAARVIDRYAGLSLAQEGNDLFFGSVFVVFNILIVEDWTVSCFATQSRWQIYRLNPGSNATFRCGDQRWLLITLERLA